MEQTRDNLQDFIRLSCDIDRELRDRKRMEKFFRYLSGKTICSVLRHAAASMLFYSDLVDNTNSLKEIRVALTKVSPIPFLSGPSRIKQENQDEENVKDIVLKEENKQVEPIIDKGAATNLAQPKIVDSIWFHIMKFLSLQEKFNMKYICRRGFLLSRHPSGYTCLDLRDNGFITLPHYLDSFVRYECFNLDTYGVCGIDISFSGLAKIVDSKIRSRMPDILLPFVQKLFRVNQFDRLEHLEMRVETDSVVMSIQESFSHAGGLPKLRVVNFNSEARRIGAIWVRPHIEMILAQLLLHAPRLAAINMMIEITVCQIILE